MELLQAEWQKELWDIWNSELEALPEPVFIYALNSGEPPLLNSSLKSLLPDKGDVSVVLEPAAAGYSPSRMVSFFQNGRKAREMTFDIFSVSAFTDKGHHTNVFGMRRESGGVPRALLFFASCLMRFYGAPMMTLAANMLDSLPIGAAIMDKNGDYVFVSRSLARWNGLSVSKMQGRSALELSDGAVSPSMLSDLTSGKISAVEWSVGKDNGETMFSLIRTHSEDMFEQVAAFVIDDAARESAEEAKAQKKRLEEIVSRSETVAFALNPSQDWRFTYVSKNIARFGISHDKNSDMRLGEHIEDFERFKKRTRNALVNCRCFSDTFRLINDSGTAFWVHAEMRVVDASDGRHIEGSLTDISPFEQVKQQIQEARELVSGQSLENQIAGEKPPLITDIVSIEYLQRHQDSFAHVFMLPSQIYDHLGRELTKSHGGCMACSSLCGASSNRMCKLWSAALAKLKVQPDSPAVLTCSSSMATAAFFPICVDKRISALWKIGAVYTNTSDKDDITAIAEKTGRSYVKTASVLQDFPRCATETFGLAVEMLSILARNISAFATSCIKLTRDIELNGVHHREVENLLTRSESVGSCVSYVATRGSDALGLMENIGKSYGFGRVCVYIERELICEWLGTGVLPTAVREISQEKWVSITENRAFEPIVSGVAQTIWRPVWHANGMFALVTADCCLERRDFSANELELLNLMLLTIGELFVLRVAQNAEKEFISNLERELDGTLVLDYNTGSVIYDGGVAVPNDIPRDALIDDDGKLSPPVRWESGGKRFTASALYWHDGRLSTLIRTE